MTPEIQIDHVLLGLTIIGIVEAIRRTGKVSEDWLPLISIVIGPPVFVLGGLAMGSSNLMRDAVIGLAVGAGATGTYALAAKVGGPKIEAKSTGPTNVKVENK